MPWPTSTLFYGVALQDKIVLPEDDPTTHPSVFRIKSLKQFSEASQCYFLMSYHTTQSEPDVLRYLEHVALVMMDSVIGCDT